MVVIVYLAGSGRGLVDLLVARGRVLGANLDGGAYVLELKVVGLGAVLEDTRLVLGVARIRYTLDGRVWPLTYRAECG